MSSSYSILEDVHNEKKQKRINLILNYYNSIVSHSPAATTFENSKKTSLDIDPNNKSSLESEFEIYLFKLVYPNLDDNDKLVEVYIRYVILYLEEFNYDLKLNGLKLLDHLLENITPSRLTLNMRSNLIYDTLQKYVNDKESIQFLDHITKTMCQFLNLIESKYASVEHQYKKHSLLVDSLLNNCYMTSNKLIKCVYLSNLNDYVKQMNAYACRHLEKIFTIAFECTDNSNISYEFDKQEVLLIKSLELIETTIEICRLRIHAHARRILNFLLKLIYFYCIDENVKENENKEDRLKLVDRILDILSLLFRNEKIKKNYYSEFCDLKVKNNLNEKFLKLIEGI